MRRWRKSDPCWIVTNTRTQSGGSVKALTPAEACERAMRCRWLQLMPGDTIMVKSFAGQDRISRTTFDSDGRMIEEVVR